MSKKNSKTQTIYKLWTKQDDKTLLECLKKSKTNAEAFLSAANILQRTKNACSNRYDVLKKRDVAFKNLPKRTSMSVWTTESNKILLDKVKNNPGNLSEAFRDTAKEIGRTYDAVAYHYYSILKPQMQKTQQVAFLTVSRDKKAANQKIVKAQPLKEKKQLLPQTTFWQRLQWLFMGKTV